MGNTSIKRNYLYNLLYEIVVVLYPLIVTPYLSRVLLPHGIGIKSYTYAIVTYFYYIGVLGIDIYGQKLISKFQNDEFNRNKTFWELFLLKFLTVLTSIGFFLILMVIINVDGKYRVIYAIWCLFLLEAMLNVNWFYHGMNSFKKLSILNTISKILMVIFVFIFIKNTNDLDRYIFIICFVPLLTTLLSIICLIGKVRFCKIKIIDSLKHLKGTFAYFVPTIAIALYSTIDKAMLEHICGEEEVGFYEQAYKMVGLTISIVSSLFPVLRTTTVSLVENGESDKYKSVVNEYLTLTFLLNFPLALGLFSISNDFVPLFFGNKYLASIRIMKMMSFIIIISSTSQFINAAFIVPYSKQTIANVVYLFAAFMNIIANLILIRNYDGFGAAISSVISELILLIGVLVISKKEINIFKRLIYIWRYIFASLVMAISIILFGKYIDLGLVYKVILEIILGAFIYLFMLMILFDKYTFSLIKNIYSYFFSKKDKIK